MIFNRFPVYCVCEQGQKSVAVHLLCIQNQPGVLSQAWAEQRRSHVLQHISAHAGEATAAHFFFFFFLHSFALLAPLSPLCLINRSVSIFSCICAPLMNMWLLQTPARLWVSLFFFLNRSISPIFRSVWVFHHFSAAVGERVILRCLRGDKDAAERYSWQTPEAVLPHCRRVCVQLGARSRLMHFTQPGKTTVREASGFRKIRFYFNFNRVDEVELCCCVTGCNTHRCGQQTQENVRWRF